jgi:anti-sigma factor (TIGR02949 family)
VNSISCREALGRVFDYLDQELTGPRLRELERHLEECRHCYDRVAFEKMLKARLRELKAEANIMRLREKIDALVEQF